MRFPLTVVNDSRDESREKDSWGTNCFLEVEGGEGEGEEGEEAQGTLITVKRPGAELTMLGLGTGQGVWNYNNLLQAVDGDTLRTDTRFSGKITAGVQMPLDANRLGVPAAFANTTTAGYESTDGVNFVPSAPYPVPGMYYPINLNGLGLTVSSSPYQTVSQTGVTFPAVSPLDAMFVPSGAITSSNGIFAFTDHIASIYMLVGTSGESLDRYTYSDSPLYNSWLDKASVSIPGYSGQEIYPEYFPVTSKFYVTVFPYSRTLVSSADVFTTSVTTTPFPPEFTVVSLTVVGVFLYAALLRGNTVWLYRTGDGVSWVPYAVVVTIQAPNTITQGLVDGIRVFPLGSKVVVYVTTFDGIFAYAISSSTGINMAVTTPGLPFDFVQAPQSAGLLGFFFKSTADAFYYDGTTLAKVTDIDYPVTTVRGAAYLDGTFYVMDPNGVIWGSDINLPLSWDGLNFITAQMEPDGGVYLARLLNFIVAFGQYTTEFFYDAGNPTGSPLSPYTSSMLNIGCASAGSVTQANNQIFFMGVSKQKGRSIYVLSGTSPTLLSTPSVERIINADDLANVSSFCVKISGHNFYVLTLGTTNITLVCDVVTGDWKEWTTSAYANAQTVELSRPSPLTAPLEVLGTKVAHGISDGDLVLIYNVPETEYNGSFIVSVLDADNFTYTMLSDPGTEPSGSPNVQNYVAGAFVGKFYTGFGSMDLIQDSVGNLYTLETATYQDSGAPIDVRIRTSLFDGGENDKKFFSRLQVIGDAVAATGYVRYTGDDYQTWSKYRPVNLASKRALLNRLGQDRRRAFELRHQADTPFRVESLEITVEKGSS